MSMTHDTWQPARIDYRPGRAWRGDWPGRGLDRAAAVEENRQLATDRKRRIAAACHSAREAAQAARATETQAMKRLLIILAKPFLNLEQYLEEREIERTHSLDK